MKPRSRASTAGPHRPLRVLGEFFLQLGKKMRRRGPLWPRLMRSGPRQAQRYIWTTELSSKVAGPGGFSPIRTVVAVGKWYGGTGRLYGAGTPE